ncbi:hypothetical protein [Brevibacillus laterosporus]|uniref:hypothetical protein n=1 Tax=Brevibacillus laterosporus TaxID=1465 RepID=UPI000CE2B8BC|nr:hypothetical protein [Brevibacillus laterosporus]MED1717541.1 hypothetical protein [Brevibacillus laterosporus]PPA87631.1 hypothetical protein C4A76_12005 [Brevibacillus laterosporus]
MKNQCFVCNYDGLYEPPYDDRGVPSDEICPCCGFHYGYDDDDVADKEVVYQQWKEMWVGNGCKWFSKGRQSPKGWNPSEQLKKL